MKYEIISFSFSRKVSFCSTGFNESHSYTRPLNADIIQKVLSKAVGKDGKYKFISVLTFMKSTASFRQFL
jgi:hypothetical protein